MTFDLGYLEYGQPPGLSLTQIISIAVPVGAACIIIFIIVLIVIARVVRSKRRVDSDNQKLLRQLTDLESSVRDQCKQGLINVHSSLVNSSHCLYVLYPLLTLRRPLLSHGYNYKASFARPG